MLKAWKNGRLVDLENPKGEYFIPPARYKPLDPSRIVGVDTETFQHKGFLYTAMVPIHLHDKEIMLEIPEGGSPLYYLLDFLLKRFGVRETRPSWTKQRKKRVRPGEKIPRRDGRRQTITPVVLVFYNAEYDLGRLVEKEDSVLRAIAMGADSQRVNVGDIELEIVYCIPWGSAPSFQWYARRNGQIVRLIGRDMWGYWKKGLAKTAQALKDLGVSAKIDVGAEIEKWTEREFSSFTEKELETLKKYALNDAKITREIYLATVTLLQQVEERVIKQDGTIPASAPGAAAKMAFSLAKRKWRKPPDWVNQLGLNAYCGGRVFNRYQGYVEGITVIDIVSAYPDAMRWLPDPVTCQYERITDEHYYHEKWRGQWGVMIVDGEGLDPAYPPLRIHGEEKLQYIYGPFENVAATIPEIVIGVESGRLRIDRIRDGVWIKGTYEGSFLREFIHRTYTIKERSEKGSPLYETAKLLMNSLYGKLIEMNQKTRNVLGIDGYFMFPNYVGLNNMKERLMEAYIKEGIPGLEKIIEQGRKERWTINEKLPMLFLKDIFAETQFVPGFYFLPAHASQVTGFVSAKLGLAAHYTQALQGDTDSIFTQNPEGLEEALRVLQRAGYPAPTEGLGSWEMEVTNAAGYLVKTKMYSLKYGEGRWKQAHHGIIGVRDPEALHAIMRALLQEKTVQYTAKPRPRRLKQSLQRGLIPGEFYAEDREITFLDDDRLEKRDDNLLYWKPFPSIMAGTGG